MSFHDTYHIATCGQNSLNTFTLASNGILVDVFITDLPPLPSTQGGRRSGGTPVDKKEEKSRKQVTVIATIGGKKYKESIVVEDKPKLTVKNIKVDINTENTVPKIKIIILD